MTDVSRRPLHGQRVLVPRTPDRAAELTDLLRSAGADVVAVPLISIETPSDAAALDQQLIDLHRGAFRWVGFTSVNAVSAVLDRAGELRLDPVVPADCQVAAVGPATAAALRTNGVPVDLVPTAAGSAENLAADWPHTTAGDAVLLPRSDLAAPGLPRALTAKGYRVVEVTAYRTVPLPPPPEIIADLHHGRISAVLFTSPSTVTSLAGVYLRPDVILGAIGRPTAAAAEQAGRHLDFVAARPTARAIVDGLIAAISPLDSAVRSVPGPGADSGPGVAHHLPRPVEA